jgi:hypothetical protein
MIARMQGWPSAIRVHHPRLLFAPERRSCRDCGTAVQRVLAAR